MSSLKKRLFKSPVHFLIELFVLHIRNCFYNFQMNPLLVALFSNIFSEYIGCLFIWFMISFATQKLLSLIRSHLLIFVFITITLGDGVCLFEGRQ